MFTKFRETQGLEIRMNFPDLVRVVERHRISAIEVIRNASRNPSAAVLLEGSAGLREYFHRHHSTLYAARCITLAVEGIGSTAERHTVTIQEGVIARVFGQGKTILGYDVLGQPYLSGRHIL